MDNEEAVRSYLVRKARKNGFLATPCTNCGQQMVIARSGKECINCTPARSATEESSNA